MKSPRMKPHMQSRSAASSSRSSRTWVALESDRSRASSLLTLVPVSKSARKTTAIESIRRACWRQNALFGLLISLGVVGGMTASVLIALHVRTDAFAGSDMKTLFASVWCLSRSQNAYSIANVQSVFAANQVIFPGSWFSHAPVYPPTTLAFLYPSEQPTSGDFCWGEVR
jgi:hypothetical protein